MPPNGKFKGSRRRSKGSRRQSKGSRRQSKGSRRSFRGGRLSFRTNKKPTYESVVTKVVQESLGRKGDLSSMLSSSALGTTMNKHEIIFTILRSANNYVSRKAHDALFNYLSNQYLEPAYKNQPMDVKVQKVFDVFQNALRDLVLREYQQEPTVSWAASASHDDSANMLQNLIYYFDMTGYIVKAFKIAGRQTTPFDEVYELESLT